ncbi:hypothetical protein [uncultured Thiodictyon sp.]|uniref:hypothetical protein n=1 Tax=uncultured Thiodictyon sp. TaxID=1846217 RepID=UPI0025FD3600|nr:hypothetical protein [uncultured Thiodictyon sp.]
MFSREVGAWPGRHPAGATTARALIMIPATLRLVYSAGTYKRQGLAFSQQIICVLFCPDL